MEHPLGAKDFQARMQRLETLIHEVERFTDPAARAHTRELVQAILDIHATGLAKVLDRLSDAGDTGRALIAELADDECVGHLLLLYALHPADLETRVRQALDRVRPYLRSHGGNVELLGMNGGVVRLRLQGSCRSCPSSALTLQSTVEEAIYERAPEVTAIEVEGPAEQPAQTAATFVPLEELTMALPRERGG
jgi:Fe-S cluster biogenesis protein NfuA